MNYVKHCYRVRCAAVGLLTLGAVLLLNGNLLASSALESGAQYPYTVIKLATGPSAAAPDDTTEVEPGPQSTEKPYTAFLPVVRNAGVASEPARLDAVSQRMLDLVNGERVRTGCGPVSINDKLSLAAQAHTEDMVANDFFDHQGSDGSWPHERVLRAGYTYSYIGESIALSTPGDADAVFALWMGSAGHRAILMNCMAEEIGIGFLDLFWTVVLATQF